MNDNEVICGCFNVTIADVKEAIKNGAKNFEEIQKVTKLGTGCQGCVDDAKKLIEMILCAN